MDETYKSVDVIANPEFEGPLLMIGNATGLPSLTLPSSFRDDTTPFGINLLGRPFDEALLCRVGSRLERIYSVVGRIPGEFS